MSIALLIVALFVILFGAEAFTNALEHLGQRLKISEGVTGSILAEEDVEHGAGPRIAQAPAPARRTSARRWVSARSSARP